MLDKPTAPAEGGVQPQVGAQSISNESLTEDVQSGDPGRVSKAIDIMQRIENGEITLEQLNQPPADPNAAPPTPPVAPPAEPTPQPVPALAAQPPSAPAQPQEPVPPPIGTPGTEPAAAPVITPQTPPAQTTRKYYDFSYRNSEAQLDDQDGHLGFKTPEGMKKALAHKTMWISDVETERDEARNRASDEIRKREEAERKATELQAKIDAMGTAAPSAAPSAPAPAPAPAAPPVQPEPSLVVPDAPVRPELPADPSDWSNEDAVAFTKWQNDLTDYTTKMTGTVSQLVTRPTEAQLEVPEQLTQAISEMQNQIKTVTESMSTMIQERAQLAQERASEAYWNSSRDFQRRHTKEFGTDKDIREVHKDCQQWMRRVAEANGVTLPYNPTDEDNRKYTIDRLALVGSYLANDPQVVANCQAFNPPDGYQQYFKMGDLLAARKEYIAQGLLGSNASLQDAWVLQQDKNGTLDQGIQNVEVAAQARGAEAALRSQTDHQQQDAVTIPPEAAQQGLAEEGWTQQEIIEALNASGDELARNPQLRARKAKIMASLPAHQRTFVPTA